MFRFRLLAAPASVWATAMVALALGAACTGAARTPTPTPSVENVLTRAREALAGAQSGRLSMQLVLTDKEGVKEGQGTGEWAAPDRMRMRMEALGSGAGHVQEVVMVGGRTMSRESDSNDWTWRELPFGDGRTLNPADLLSSLKTEGLQRLPDETLDGGQAFHLADNTTNRIQFPPATPGEPAPTPMVMKSRSDALIDKSTYRLLRLTIDIDVPDPAGVSGAGSSVMTQHAVYTFYDYNAPITIELPEPGTR